MSDLDQVSAMIGGLQADVRRVIEWTDTHEKADQHRFELLAEQITSHHEKNSMRVSALELNNAEARGGWKLMGLLGTVAGGLGAFIYHLLGIAK